MSTPAFWIVFLASLLTSTMVTVSAWASNNSDALVLSGLFWLGTIVQPWARWSRYGTKGLGRLGAGIGAGGLLWVLWQWLASTDVFTVHQPNCPPRSGTFWPVLIVTFAGIALSGRLIWGSWERFDSERARLTIRSSLWWITATAWASGCVFVFARNISLPVVRASFFGAGHVVGAVLLFVGGILGIAFLLSLPSKGRRKRAAADLARIGPDVQRQILAQIDQQARSGNFQLLYRPTASGNSAVDAARIGGEPAALPNEPWPVDEDGKPALFLLQVPLSAPLLPPTWRERMLTIFLADHGLHIRSYAPDESARLVMSPKPADITLLEIRELQPVAIPYVQHYGGQEHEQDDYLSAEYFLRGVPAVRSLLEGYTQHPDHVLSAVLSGDPNAALWSADSGILSGGDPALIQGPHDPKCPTCDQPMRFLLQFFDVTDDFLLGDCGVGYVYGCDEHPEQCLGFVDCY